MADTKPTTIPEYLESAPLVGQPHLLRLYEILKSVAPDAEETIKWGTPFFIEPRFLFGFSAHKAHMGFTPSPEGLDPFRKELEKHSTTRGIFKITYKEPVPEDLIRRIAERRFEYVSAREDDSFW